MLISGQYAVLAKQPYREKSFLLRGLHPDFGIISIVVNPGNGKASVIASEIDLFREYELEFEDDDSGKTIFSAAKMELCADFSAIADNSKHFIMAGRIASYLLNNTPARVPAPYTFDSLVTVLGHLAGNTPDTERWSMLQCAVVIKTVSLYENGLLPDGGSPQQMDFIENLVEAGVGNGALPQCREEYWTQLNQWLDSLIAYHKLKK